MVLKKCYFTKYIIHVHRCCQESVVVVVVIVVVEKVWVYIIFDRGAEGMLVMAIQLKINRSIHQSLLYLMSGLFI